MKTLENIQKKKEKIAIGLMSGTSVDGIDTVLIKISGFNENTVIETIDFIETPFSDDFKKLILKNSDYKSADLREITRLNFALSYKYCKSVEVIIAQNNIKSEDIDFIGSHGQTIQHLPETEFIEGVPIRSTLQIGDPSVIAKCTGIITVGDFRTGDMALGGQGAPLVPFFDYMVLRNPEKNRVLLNIGGISNVTFLSSVSKNKNIIAFDTGPGNMMIDYLMKKYFNRFYDKDGEIAYSGKINFELLNEIIKKDNYLNIPLPKSTGRERYSEEFVNLVISGYAKELPENIIRTFSYYTAWSISYSLNKYINEPIDEIIFSGGGGKNSFVINELKKLMEHSKVISLQQLGINPDAKEAICFAFLANQTLNYKINNLISVTGATNETILGKICLP